MPTYMDIHDVPGVTPEEVARAHEEDMRVQQKYGVHYHKYWFNQEKGKVFCLCTAPSAEAAEAVHKEAHGLAAEQIMEITPDIADAFMGAAEISSEGAVLSPDKMELDSGTRTILFTDIVGSTDMTQRLGDDKALIFLDLHDGIVRKALETNNGHEVKHTGDGIMAAFHSAASAVRCAMQVQGELTQHGKQNPAQTIQVRIGMAVGEPVEKHNDLFGATVQLAARLCAHAEPEQILISNAVAELCVGKGFPLKEIGKVTLKGFDQPVHVYCVTCG